MKRMGNVLVAAAMILGTFGAVGCNRPSDNATQPEAAPVAAPAPQTVAPAAPAAQPEAKVVVAPATARIPAPPALRVEYPGSAPSAHHRWMRGFWRWDGPRTVYVWTPGFWEDVRMAAPYAPPALRFEDPGYAPAADYTFTPGFWRWDGREYVWIGGHWTARRDAGFYYQPRWENVNGHWERRFDRDDARRDFDGRRGESAHCDEGRVSRPAARATVTVTRPLPVSVTVKHGRV